MLEITVSGPISAGKTTATEILGNLLTDAGYNVKLVDGRGRNCPPRTSHLRKLPATFTKTDVRLVDCETPEPDRENHTASIAFGLIAAAMVATAIFVDGSPPYILTALTASVISVLFYKAVLDQ